MKQAALDLSRAPEPSFATLITGESNRAALAYLRGFRAWPSPVALVWGPEGSGKTTMGRAWASESGGQFLDRADTVNEARLFAAINNALQSQSPPLLLASRLPPSSWNATIPDLAHRLANTPTFRVDEPGEDILRPLLVQLFHDQGRAVDDHVVDYMLTRCPRSVAELRRIVAEIEDEAQTELADVTRTFVSRFLSRQPELF